MRNSKNAMNAHAPAPAPSPAPGPSRLRLLTASIFTLSLAAALAVILSSRRRNRTVLTTLAALAGLDVLAIDTDGDGSVSASEASSYAARRVLGDELLGALLAIRDQLTKMEEGLRHHGASPAHARYPFAVNAALLYRLWTDPERGPEVRRAATAAASGTEDGEREGRDAPESALEEGRHWCRYAGAAYGPATLTLLGLARELPPLTYRYEDALRWCVVMHCGIREDDVRLLRLAGSSVSLPCHFVAVDRSRRRVVLCVRGTQSMKDTVTDLVCAAAPVPHLDWRAGGSSSVPNGGGGDGPAPAARAHEGIARAAGAVLRSALPAMAAALDGAGPGYGVLVTGHSLGAGTASLVALELLAAGARAEGAAGGGTPPPPPPWLDPAADGPLLSALSSVAARPLDCWAFAPPPTFTGVPPPGASDRIRSFVHRSDCVPTLSALSVFRMLRLIDAVDDAPLGLGERVAYLSGTCDGEAEGRVRCAVMDQLAAMGGERLPEGAGGEAADAFAGLQLVGGVYALLDRGATDGDGEGTAAAATIGRSTATPTGGGAVRPAPYRCRRRRAADYGHVPVCSTILSDHLPHKYELALQGTSAAAI